mmetsp:Transcript_58255/g.138648  ORF Transcript_58255/g.138648 Transcript_58255/m.138648 type:complete len:343 (+) Transcript_58255:193-1221(+)
MHCVSGQHCLPRHQHSAQPVQMSRRLHGRWRRSGMHSLPGRHREGRHGRDSLRRVHGRQVRGRRRVWRVRLVPGKHSRVVRLADRLLRFWRARPVPLRRGLHRRIGLGRRMHPVRDRHLQDFRGCRHVRPVPRSVVLACWLVAAHCLHVQTWLLRPQRGGMPGVRGRIVQDSLWRGILHPLRGQLDDSGEQQHCLDRLRLRHGLLRSEQHGVHTLPGADKLDASIGGRRGLCLQPWPHGTWRGGHLPRVRCWQVQGGDGGRSMHGVRGHRHLLPGRQPLAPRVRVRCRPHGAVWRPLLSLPPGLHQGGDRQRGMRSLPGTHSPVKGLLPIAHRGRLALQLEV